MKRIEIAVREDDPGIVQVDAYDGNTRLELRAVAANIGVILQVIIPYLQEIEADATDYLLGAEEHEAHDNH
jgi:hypothetical protein